ncbi:hypothetical protein EON65_50305, partial [archaeon]
MILTSLSNLEIWKFSSTNAFFEKKINLETKNVKRRRSKKKNSFYALYSPLSAGCSHLDMTIESDFIRDINRAKDADRNSRKRGLQKLCETLPWDDKKQRVELQAFIQTHLYPIVQMAVADSVEKCREFALKMTHLILKVWTAIPIPTLSDLTTSLVSRINDHPFPEPAEELRQLVVESLQGVVKVVSKR